MAQDSIEIWGPIPAPMERKAGRYRAHMVILSQDRARMHFFYGNGGRKWYIYLNSINYVYRLMLIHRNLTKMFMI
jgi:primosomal protein N'